MAVERKKESDWIDREERMAVERKKGSDWIDRGGKNGGRKKEKIRLDRRGRKGWR